MMIGEPMGEYCCRIEKMRNGYEVELKDPAIIKKNRDPKQKGWQDPMVSYVFKTEKEVTDFLTKNLSKLAVDDEFDTAFDDAAEEASED
jgi:hypothetical protein